MHGEFLVNLICLIPWGYLLAFIDHKLKVFWLIKELRIGQLNDYMADKKILPIINTIIVSQQKKFLDDKEMYYDIISDHIFLTHKIYLSNAVRVFRLVTQILFIAYLIG